MAKPILSVELAVRCERSEHGKSQLSIKFLCSIFIFVFLSFIHHFQISLSLSATLCLFASKSHCAVRNLPITRKRLEAGGGYDTVHAGYKRSYSHYTFCGVTPPLAPNRTLSAAIFVCFCRFTFGRYVRFGRLFFFYGIFGLY